MKEFPQKEKLIGKYCNLREVTVDDAEFILSLRCDPKKSKYLNPTENNLEKQKDYIRRYLTLDKEWYFIIEDKSHTPLGTTRIYNVKDKQFTGGSWIMVDNVDVEIILESEFLAKNYAFNVLDFEKEYFDVRKGNKKVIRHNLDNGAKIVGESDIDYFFEYYRYQFNESKKNIQMILKISTF